MRHANPRDHHGASPGDADERPPVPEPSHAERARTLVHLGGGFGVMGWVAADDYGEARPDPLAEHGPGILEHMNEDHAESLVLLARHLGPHEAEEARMTRVDRLGFHLRLKVGGRYRGCRLAFPKEVGGPGQVRSVLVEMVQQAREALAASSVG